MNKLQQRTYTRINRVHQHCEDNPQSPDVPALTTEVTGLGVAKAAFEAAGVSQDGGAGAITSAIGNRRFVDKQLRELMRSLAKAARRLDPIAHPEVAGKMRMSGTNSFAKLLTRALVFKETLAPIKQVFVEMGAPADVDEELNDLIEALEGSGDRKNTGLGTQIGGTRSLRFITRKAIRHMQKLDAIFTQLYRKDPVKLALWKTANRATPYPGVAEGPAAPAPVAPIAPAGGGA